MAPVLSPTVPFNRHEDEDGKGLKLLLVTDPRCQTLPLMPHNFDSWGTVYAYFITKSLVGQGAEVEMESISEILRGSTPCLNEDRDFDAAIIVVNRASSIYGAELFTEIRKIIRKDARVYALDDHDTGIEFEDLRFSATVIEPLEETVAAPPVDATAFEPLCPSGTLSCKSGSVNVLDPSPEP